jgi:hypothetical protein
VGAAEVLTYPEEREGEAAPAQAGKLPLAPGVRTVEGRPMYSAAWLDFEPQQGH